MADQTQTREHRANWTWMVYMAGDNNLSEAAEADLEEMRSVAVSTDVEIVVQIDNAGDTGTRRLHLEAGIPKLGQPAAWKTWDIGETDSGAPEVLLEFVRWAAGNFPAERYALILWNHGTGWEPSEIERVAASVGTTTLSETEAAERAATPIGRLLFRSSLAEILRRPTPRERAICSDDGTGHSLDTVELGNVLAQSAAALGQPIDLLGMDACLMSNLEVAFEVRSNARYLVASEEDEPGEGWPYETILTTLTAAPDLETPELARVIVDAYIESYADRPGLDLTQTAIDLGRLDQLTRPIDDLATALTTEMKIASSSLWAAQYEAVRFGRDTLWDLGDICRRLAADDELDQLATVRKSAEVVCQVLAPSPDRVIIHERHRGSKVANCTGLSMYLLPPIMELSPHYGALDYSKRHRWHAMLERYHQS